jgi:hypothetical protein
MSLGHDFQDIVVRGGVIRGCRYCTCKDTDAKAAAPCAGNTMPMPAVNDPRSTSALMTASIFPPPLNPVGTTSAIAVLKSLDADVIEAKIVEMKSEIAGLEVLLAAARARDLKAEKSS